MLLAATAVTAGSRSALNAKERLVGGLGTRAVSSHLVDVRRLRSEHSQLHLKSARAEERERER